VSELGQVLQRAREEKGISLDDIQRMTKIQVRYLEAIERGHFHLLPGHFYARAFIKSYAEAVGLDPNDILSHFQSDLPAQPPQEHMERLRRRRSSVANTPLQAGRWVTQALLVLFIVLVVGVIYMALVNNQETQPTPIPSDTARNDQVQLPQTTPTTPVSPGTSGDVNPNVTVEEKPEEPAAPQTNVTFLSQQGSVYSYQVTGGDKLKIYVKATNGTCWLQVREAKNSKNVLAEATLVAGKEQTVEAGATAYVRLGNPRAVEMKVNDVSIAMNDIKMIPASVDLQIKQQ